MLYKQRKLLQQLEEAEARGESFWTPSFDRNVRQKLRFAFQDAAGDYFDEPINAARDLILRDEGVPYLTNAQAGFRQDFLRHLEICEDEDFASAVEAIVLALVQADRYALGRARAFIEAANDILARHRVAFEIVQGRMVPFESRELHQEVVAPTLRLLAGLTGWDAVEAAYQDALREIAQDNGADSITDAGTALQEALQAVGCEGNALGPLTKSAKKLGILAAHDQTLMDAIGKMMDWVSADRSEMGDAHHASRNEVTREDAWLTVHIVGALILRLAGDPRAKPA